MTTTNLRTDLQPVVATLLDRHLETTREWFPHELVPWSKGRDFVAGVAWDAGESRLPAAARIALVVNLLTEDNLPYYSATLGGLGTEGAWGEWMRRWTAEEGRHAIVIRDYLTVTRSVDPVALERERMGQVSKGEVPEFDSTAEAIVYTTLQELATRISHRNTGNLLDDDAGRAVMTRVAADENLHHLFYRDLASAAIELDPSQMVVAMERVVREFAMPGTGIPDFPMRARVMAKAGVYDFSIHHDQILVPVVLSRWGLTDLTGLDSEAERARDDLVTYIDRLGKVARRVEERRTVHSAA
ncbi:MAG: acyl-[acyl-carrier-protein] desaturase [Actinomycetota bacterium]|jgi:acyl-[acyl-carrier-protein] desaturase|nr:acyl-[acyl-carrier-protein] desaturase [Actinomycetota bacterium]